MPAWLALAAGLVTAPAPAPAPAPEGPEVEAPAPLPTTDPTAAGPKIPSPRAMPPPGTGPGSPVPEDSFGALGLTRQQDGTAVYVDPGRRFTAALNPDGTVRFGDRWGRDQHGRRMRGSGWALRQIGTTGIGIGGPAEWLLGLQDRMGGPERHAAAKREFLNRTAELRTAMTVAFTLELLQVRLHGLEQELFELWNDTTRDTPAARRELLFQRWDECDEAYAVGPQGEEITAEARSMIDQARAETAEKARRVIEAFIRRHAPRAGPSAYTRAELADMNRRRRSKQPFAPYDEKP